MVPDTGAGVGLFAASVAAAVVVGWIGWTFVFQPVASSGSDLHQGKKAPQQSQSLSRKETEYVPPLPECVCDVLSKLSLCYLATVEGGFPHLCLMNFTFVKRKQESIIMTTRKNTKKYQAIVENRNVSILVSDFSHIKDTAPGTVAITLSGKVNLPEGDEADRLRQLHVENNPNYRQFIVGDDIAVFTVTIDRARICDIKDNVQHWAANGPT
eukprot:m.212895 g.212895  ORF g.212895 m.212895 type:complete len:212 (-) comp33136_c0_seq5:30-665(-)